MNKMIIMGRKGKFGKFEFKIEDEPKSKFDEFLYGLSKDSKQEVAIRRCKCDDNSYIIGVTSGDTHSGEVDIPPGSCPITCETEIDHTHPPSKTGHDYPNLSPNDLIVSFRERIRVCAISSGKKQCVIIKKK